MYFNIKISIPYKVYYFQALRDNKDCNLFSNYWWFPIFEYLEENVSCPLPQKFEFPKFTSPKKEIQYISSIKV